jgi:hypothetical protein
LDTSGYPTENGNYWDYLDFCEVFFDRLVYSKVWILWVIPLKMGMIGIIWILVSLPVEDFPAINWGNSVFFSILNLEPATLYLASA